MASNIASKLKNKYNKSTTHIFKLSYLNDATKRVITRIKKILFSFDKIFFYQFYIFIKNIIYKNQVKLS